MVDSGRVGRYVETPRLHNSSVLCPSLVYSTHQRTARCSKKWGGGGGGEGGTQEAREGYLVDIL